jgi:branched-chain amino acid transport system permease protein
MHLPDGLTLLQAVVSGLLIGALFALAALGLSLVVGVVRIVNLMHGELVLLGAYVAYGLVQATGLNALLVAPLAALTVALLGWPLERFVLQPVVRHGEEAPLLTTFALSVIIQNLLVFLLSADTRSIDSGYGATRLQVGGVSVPAMYLVGFAVALLVCACVHLLITRTAFGRRIRASAENPADAAVVGVPVRRLYALTFMLAAGVSGLGGALLGMMFSFTPSSGVEYLLTGFTVVVLGGLGSVIGTLVGGLALGLVESLAAAFLGDGYRLFVGLVAFLVFLALRPQGLFGRRA